MLALHEKEEDKYSRKQKRRRKEKIKMFERVFPVSLLLIIKHTAPLLLPG